MFQTELINQCKKNSRKAQLQLYKQYCSGMFIVARRFMKNDFDAEDAMQEAFIKAFEKLDQFKAEVTFGSWLKRIVIHTCLDKLKLNKLELLQLDETYLKIADEPERMEVDEEITIHEVKECIALLPEKYKYVVVLYLIEGYDHQEISEILGITQVASRTQLLRGKKKLQELLILQKNGTRH